MNSSYSYFAIVTTGKGGWGRSDKTEVTTTTTMEEAAATGVNTLHFLVSIKVIIGERVCNVLLIFIAPH